MRQEIFVHLIVTFLSGQNFGDIEKFKRLTVLSWKSDLLIFYCRKIAKNGYFMNVFLAELNIIRYYCK